MEDYDQARSARRFRPRRSRAEFEVEFDDGTLSGQPAVQALGATPEVAYLGLPVTADGRRVLISTGVPRGKRKEAGNAALPASLVVGGGLEPPTSGL